MKIFILAVAGLGLLILGYAIGYPRGEFDGFRNGSEWAIVQAEIVAREAGMFMPVRMEGGVFRVKYKQPRNLHQRAWKAADHFDDLAIGANCEMRPIGRAMMARTVYVNQ